MRVLGNIIWFFCSGLWAAIAWYIVGFLLCITVIGIPFGLQCFKIGSFGLFPFGKNLVFFQPFFQFVLEYHLDFTVWLGTGHAAFS